MVIYLIRNKTNGKGYVGQTIRSIELRWMEHLQEARSGSMFPIHCAIRKYGAGNFEHCELNITDNLLELNRLEVEQVEKQGTLVPSGYNLIKGGNRPPSHLGKVRSPEFRAKVSSANKGKKRVPFTQEWRNNISRAHKGKPKTPETRDKMSAARSKWWNKKKAKTNG